jgi:hypothetical protein
MTTENTAFAWLEIPSTALTSSIEAGFTFTFMPELPPPGDNVTPPRPRNLPNSNPKVVSIWTRGGTWQISGNTGAFKVAGGPSSMMSSSPNQWDPTADKATWNGDEDVLIFAIKVKP